MPVWPFEPDGGGEDVLLSSATPRNVNLPVEALRVEDDDDPVPEPAVRERFRCGHEAAGSGPTLTTSRLPGREGSDVIFGAAAPARGGGRSFNRVRRGVGHAADASSLSFFGDGPQATRRPRQACPAGVRLCPGGDFRGRIWNKPAAKKAATIAVRPQGDTRLFVRVRQEDGHRMWSSAIYLCRAVTRQPHRRGEAGASAGSDRGNTYVWTGAEVSVRSEWTIQAVIRNCWSYVMKVRFRERPYLTASL